MIEVTGKLLGGQLLVKFQIEGVKQLFEVMGDYMELLGGDDACGMCGSHHIYPRARDAKKTDGKKVTYYELVCADCTAKLAYGQHSEGGTLWAKRADANGLLDHRGWSKYLGLAAPKEDKPKPQERQAPSRSPTSQDSPALTAILSDASRYEQAIDDLFYGIVEALGENQPSDPKSAVAWKDLNKDNPSDAALIRRMFNYKMAK